MIEGQAQHTGGTNLDLPFVDNRSFADPAHTENRRLPRIDDGREGVDSVGAEVGNREGAALEIIRGGGTALNLLDQLVDFFLNLFDR